MKNRSFPAAQTILLLIAAIVALLTWVITAGSYNSLVYQDANKEFMIHSPDSSYTTPATQESLSELDVKIPVEKFTTGAIYKPVSIPNTYQELAAQPQGFFALLSAPIKGTIAAADIIF